MGILIKHSRNAVPPLIVALASSAAASMAPLSQVSPVQLRVHSVS